VRRLGDPLGLWDGSTENKRVAVELLADLVDRGFDVERSASRTSSPTGSRVREKRRVLTPASICSITTAVSGSRSAKCA